jgi:N-acetylglucosaminyl-diphospho-decaprenol L-rhamnosyltransferase
MFEDGADLSIIIVNWNTRDLLRSCIASIEANCDNLSVEVVVVDNASSDDSVQMIQCEFPWVRLIASQENLGYAGGNNLGVKECRGRYLLILNPDTEIVGNALQQMVAYLEEHPAVGAVGPQLLNSDGSVQSSRRRFPGLATALFKDSPFSWRWFPDNRFVRAHTMADRPDGEIQAVDWLVGAAIMIRREVWQTVGPFDERFFMYSDEVDWCHRCRDQGGEIHYLPTAQIMHHHRGSSSQVGRATQLRFHQSRVLYFQKYFGAGWAGVIRLFFLANYAFFLVEDVLKWALGRHPAARRQRISDYWKALRSGLR